MLVHSLLPSRFGFGLWTLVGRWDPGPRNQREYGIKKRKKVNVTAKDTHFFVAIWFKHPDRQPLQRIKLGTHQ